MKEYIWRRSLFFLGCFIYINACQAPQVHASDEKIHITSFTPEELLAGGGERILDAYSEVVQEELHEKILHEE